MRIRHAALYLLLHAKVVQENSDTDSTLRWMRPWNILWGRSQIMLIDSHLIKEGKLWLQIVSVAWYFIYNVKIVVKPFSPCPPPPKVSKISLPDPRSRDPHDNKPLPLLEECRWTCSSENTNYFNYTHVSPVWYSLFCVLVCCNFCHTMNLPNS